MCSLYHEFNEERKQREMARRQSILEDAARRGAGMYVCMHVYVIMCMYVCVFVGKNFYLCMYVCMYVTSVECKELGEF
jgi:hypothetical protein